MAEETKPAEIKPENLLGIAAMQAMANDSLQTVEEVAKPVTIATFEKISYENYYNMYKQLYINNLKLQGQQTLGYKEDDIKEEAKRCYDAIILPFRSNRKTALYNFFFPFQDIELKPEQTTLIPTGIKCRVDDGWMLNIVPDRNLAMRFRVQIDTTVDIIDGSYYNNAYDEGHIMLKITNDSKEGYTAIIQYAQPFAAGYFTQYGLTTTDDEDLKGLENFIKEQEEAKTKAQEQEKPSDQTPDQE